MPWHWPTSTASTRRSSTRNGYWKRSGVELVCAALICHCGQACAELSIRPLDQQPFDTDVAELFPLGQRDLLLRTRGWREPKPKTSNGPSSEPWSTLYVLAPGGQVKERVELPYGIYQVIAPFGDGFAVQRLVTTKCAPNCSYGSSEPTQIVVYKSAADPQPKVVFEPGAPFHSPRLYGTTRGQDLYVMEMGAQFRLTRIDSSGQIAWQKTTGWLESSSFATTDDGVVFVQYAAENDPSMVLRAIDREGRERWNTPIPSTRGYEAIYSATEGVEFITLPTYPADLTQARDKRRLLSFHARTGKLMSDVLVPQFAYATGTRHGLLVTGSMLGQSYVGMITAFGDYSWLRRYVADRNLSDIRRATTNYRGDLILVTREQRTTIDSPTSVVVTDPTAEGIGEARGGCLDPKWREAVELASQLSMSGLSVLPPTPEELMSSTNDVQGCARREQQFIAFMQGLSAAMDATPARAREYGETLAVRLTASGETLRLESYTADRSGYPSAGVSLEFASPFDQPAQFWNAVATQVRPHLLRMQELDERFARATNFRYMAHHRGPGNIGDVLPALEKAARTVDERIAKIEPAKLAEIRREGPHGFVAILLRTDSFGAWDAKLPLASADRTFLDLVEENRRAAARGQIVIRD
jgi:hypothetical protein